LPFFGNFSWDIYRIPQNPNIKVDMWHPDVGLRCRIPHSYLSQLKTRAIPLAQTPNGKEHCRPSAIYHRIYLDSPNPNIKVDIWHPSVDLRCRIPPSHLSQLKA
jgi:hypothetical protein